MSELKRSSFLEGLAAMKAALGDVAADERRDIAEWLRNTACDHGEYNSMMKLADAIEKGEHRG